MSERPHLGLWAALLVAAMAFGCKKGAAGGSDVGTTNRVSADQPAPAVVAPPSPRGPGPMPEAPPPAVIQAQADTGATLTELSAELRKYVARTRSVPKNFEEFIAKSQVRAPDPPAGKKYAIRDKAVVLVKR